MALAEERRNRLLELVRTRGFASLPELADELGVSESTVRRDLDHLEGIGTAKRTHGGVFYAGSSPQLPHFDERQPAQWDKKRPIAERAAELVQNGDTLLLDGGIDHLRSGPAAGRPAAADRDQFAAGGQPVCLGARTPTLVLVGGYVYPRTGVSLGPYANDMLAGLSVRKTMLSVAGINERGFFNSNLLLVETERAMMRCAEEVIVVADSTKFGHQSLAHLCPLDAVDCLVVDAEIEPEWQQRSDASGRESC